VTTPENQQGQFSYLFDAAKPKGVMTAFNYYAKHARKLVYEEYDNALPNNDLNKILGRRWKELSEDEKAPFLEEAEGDRKRYQEVCI